RDKTSYWGRAAGGSLEASGACGRIREQGAPRHTAARDSGGSAERTTGSTPPRRQISPRTNIFQQLGIARQGREGVIADPTLRYADRAMSCKLAGARTVRTRVS